MSRLVTANSGRSPMLAATETSLVSQVSRYPSLWTSEGVGDRSTFLQPRLYVFSELQGRSGQLRHLTDGARTLC